MVSPLEFIERRRRQIHVHSIIYYHMDNNILPDAVYDKWSVDLVDLHKKHPKLVLKGYEFAMFSTWDGSSGYHLDVTDWSANMAAWLVRESQNRT